MGNNEQHQIVKNTRNHSDRSLRENIRVSCILFKVPLFVCSDQNIMENEENDPMVAYFFFCYSPFDTLSNRYDNHCSIFFSKTGILFCFILKKSSFLFLISIRSLTFKFVLRNNESFF